MTMTVKGIQQVQRWNTRAVANMKPGGVYQRTIRDIIIQIQRAEVGITHVITGTLKASHRIEARGMMARTYIDPAAVNPVTHNKPSVYGVIEEGRGGDHAFALRTVRDYSPRIIIAGIARIGKSLT